MALAQDQRAMLQLLLERGQSYDDIASLLGGSRDDVRKRARLALEDLGGEDPDAEVGLTDYLLGQADPIGRADAVRHLQADASALALAEELSAKLRLLAPDAELPDLPQPKKRRRAAAAAPSPASPGGDVAPADGDGEVAVRRAAIGEGLTQKQTRLIAALAAGAVILLFGVLAIAGVFSGEDEGPPAETTATNEAGSTVTEGATDEVARIALEPQGNLEAGGEAVVGLANQTQPYVELRLQGLPDVAEDEAYLLWFLLEDESGFPVPQPLEVTENGSYDDRLTIPVEALGIVAQSRELAISIVNRGQLQKEIDSAIEEAASGQPTDADTGLRFSGEPVLRGEVPRVPTDAPGAGGGEVPTP